MATKKHHHKKKPVHHKPKKVGALAPGMETGLMLTAGTFTGALIQRGIGTVLAKQTFITDPTQIKYLNYGVAFVEAVGGGIVAVKAPHPFVKGLGIGLGVEAGISVLQTAGILSGMGEVDPASLQFPVRNQLGAATNSATTKMQIGQNLMNKLQGRDAQLGAARMRHAGTTY